MALSRKSVVIGLSVLWLFVPFIMAAYALHATQLYRLPIHNILDALMLALPPVAAVAMGYPLNFGNPSRRGGSKSRISGQPPFAITILLIIISTILTTLSATYLPSSDVSACRLRSAWQSLFRAKDTRAIRHIQDALECCGLQNALDMPWPFPAKDVPADSCRVRYGRKNGCLEGWSAMERRVGGLLVATGVMVIMWVLLVDVFARNSPRSYKTWSRTTQPSSEREDDEESSNNGPRRALDYRPVEDQPYRDNLITEAEEDDVEGRLGTNQPPNIVNGKVALTATAGGASSSHD